MNGKFQVLKGKTEITDQRIESRPVQTQERIDIIDILRGVALLGILIINMRDYNSLGEMFSPERLWTSSLDRTTEWFIAGFVNEKFYSLFSFLFGLGFAVQMIRLEKRGVNFIKIYSRRLIVLLIIGLLHGIFIWWGDVLAAYALFGFILLFLRKLSLKTILYLSLCALLLPIGYSTVKLSVSYLKTGDQKRLSAEMFPQELNPEEKIIAEKTIQMYSQGSYNEILKHRIDALSNTYSAWLYRSYGAQILGMFLLGLYTGRKGILNDLSSNNILFQTLRRFGFVAIGIYSILFLIDKLNGIASSFILNLITFELGKVMRTVFVLFYASCIILLFQQERWKKKLSLLAYPGRMALTNYLLQSILCTMLFYSYGFGLYGSISPSFGLLLTIIIYSSQVLMSIRWLKIFRFGPMEWIWRSLTYGKWQPMKLQAT